MSRTQGLPGITLGPDNIHYDTPGMADFGQRFAVKMQMLLNTQGQMP